MEEGGQGTEQRLLEEQKLINTHSYTIKVRSRKSHEDARLVKFKARLVWVWYLCSYLVAAWTEAVTSKVREERF